MTTNFERDLGVQRGARFFRDGERVMFAFGIDPATTIGPREATQADQSKHPDAWQRFVDDEALSPLDRDADGAAGGSLPKVSRKPKARKVADEPADDHSEDD